MNGKQSSVKCPYCKKGDLHIHPGGRKCGCDECHSVFNYPSLIPFPTLSVGTPNPSALWDLVEYIAEIEAAEVPS